MKKIINGIRFDTDKAKRIGTGTSGGSMSDFRYFVEELYITPRSKKFFLKGEGHGMTRWAKTFSDNTRGWGSDILPLTKQDALEWAEQYMDPDDIMIYFSDMVKDA